MKYASIIELSESALRRNLKFLRSYLGQAPVICSVVKGNAYGHAIEAWVPLAERCGVRHFSVFDAGEALRVHRASIAGSYIMIMGLIDNDQLEWAVDEGIGFWVFDNDRLNAGLEAARRVGKPARIHLEVETGMNRTGLQEEQLFAAAAIIKSNSEQLRVDGVCTHYAGAESIGNHVRVKTQIRVFNDKCRWLNQQGISWRWRHTACSAAAINYPETIMDLARIGIAHYGFWPSEETRMHYVLHGGGNTTAADPLRRVLRWSSHVMSVKPVRPGEFVGYGTTYLTTRPQLVASVPVGYYHGFARSLSNLGYVAVRGRRAQVIGIVNMNMVMIDVTDIPGVQKGDEVVLIGKQKKQQITVGSFSDMTRFLNYEVLVRLPADIPRIVVK